MFRARSWPAEAGRQGQLVDRRAGTGAVLLPRQIPGWHQLGQGRRVARLKEGMTLSEAYYRALLFTGKVVMLTGFTLAIGVATWAFSPIKFQADMGVLLAAMFLWNMLGALILIPALAHFLLPHRSDA